MHHPAGAVYCVDRTCWDREQEVSLTGQLICGGGVGLFDWLFGKKKDPYARGQSKADYGSHQPPYSGRAESYGRPPQKGERTEKLSFREKRSNRPLEPVKDQTVPVGDYAHFGGTRDNPDPHTDIDALRKHKLPEILHLDSLAELAGVERSEILFLAARPGWNDPTHYTLKEMPKKSGSSRLLMAPMPRLKAVQRALHAKLVSQLPVHEAAHGFRRGRDILSGASVHVGRDVVVCVDIQDFFPSFTHRRVAGYLRSLGYGRGVSVTLANLMTARLRDASTRTKDGKWQRVNPRSHPDVARRYHPELPQGAPTSPGLANAISRRMDLRLAALAQKFGGDYTRYADDLCFSGFDDLAKSAGHFLQIVRQIVRTEGLVLNEKKTRIMRKGRQQRVTGVVVNEKTNVSRREYDQLKAILHNCIKHGPDGQNREGHEDFRGYLQGRIAHFKHVGPERGQKLQAMFDRIRW